MSHRAIERLKEAVKDKPATKETQGRFLTSSVVEVAPVDILAACKRVIDLDAKIDAMRDGSAGATESSKNVFVNVADVLHLLDHVQAEEPLEN